MGSPQAPEDVESVVGVRVYVDDNQGKTVLHAIGAGILCVPVLHCKPERCEPLPEQSRNEFIVVDQ